MGRRPGSKNRRNIDVELRSRGVREVVQHSAFPIDNTDSIDFNDTAASVSANAKEKGKIADAVKEIPEIFSPEQVAWLFDAYAAILSFTYSLLLKIDYKAISEELEFDTDDKERMSKPLARILSKYCPSEWAGMSAEIELITGLGIWTVASFGRAKGVGVKLAEEKQNRNRTHAVDPMRRQPQGEVLTPA